MKRVILINISALAIFIYSWCSYNHRQNIINNEKPINNFSVIEVNYGGYRRRPNILIEFNNKQYYVGISREQCRSFSPKIIKLYYDKDKDDVFEPSELVIRHIVWFFILYLASCIWLYTIIKNRRKKGN